MEHRLDQILVDGGIPIWLLVGCSVLVLGIGLERTLSYRGLISKVQQLFFDIKCCFSRNNKAEGRLICERSTESFSSIFLSAWETQTDPNLLIANIHRQRIRMNAAMKKRLWILGTIGAVAPFIGLFGTVIGVIDAMTVIANTQGQGGIDMLSGSIGEALWATAAGIAVAVEAVVVFNFLKERQRDFALEFRLIIDEFIQLFLAETDIISSNSIEKNNDA